MLITFICNTEASATEEPGAEKLHAGVGAGAARKGGSCRGGLPSPMAARTNYVLVDYENVQTTDLAMLRDGPCKVKVFLGANQAKIPVALAAALQELGANAEYVLLQSSGSNALDFHIAYYIGVLSAQEPSASFHI